MLDTQGTTFCVGSTSRAKHRCALYSVALPSAPQRSPERLSPRPRTANRAAWARRLAVPDQAPRSSSMARFSCFTTAERNSEMRTIFETRGAIHRIPMQTDHGKCLALLVQTATDLTPYSSSARFSSLIAAQRDSETPPRRPKRRQYIAARHDNSCSRRSCSNCADASRVYQRLAFPAPALMIETLRQHRDGKPAVTFRAPSGNRRKDTKPPALAFSLLFQH
jgi:hypothetical protein